MIGEKESIPGQISNEITGIYQCPGNYRLIIIYESFSPFGDYAFTANLTHGESKV